MTTLSRLSIRTKIALLMTVLLAIISIVVYRFVPSQLHRQIVEAVEQKSAALTEMAAFSAADGLYTGDRARVAAALSGLRTNPDLTYLVLLDAKSDVFSSFNELAANEVEYLSVSMQPVRMPQRPLQAGQQVRAASNDVRGGIAAGGRIYQTMTPVRHEGKLIGRLFTGVTLDGANFDASRSRATIALITLIAFIGGSVAVFALSTVITGPLGRIVETAETIAAGDFSKRAAVTSDDEVGQLARSFNGMVDQLEQWNHTLEERVDERTRALTTSEERYRLLFERNHAGVYIAGEDGRIIDCNDACAKLFRYDSREEFLESGRIEYMQPHHRDSVLRRLRDESSITNEEVELRGRNNHGVWALENVRRIAPQDGKPAMLEGILLDISERKHAEAEIAFKAYHDPLTNLPNRSLFLDRLEIALANAERNRTNMAVLFLDLDDMKSINDTFGHATGDGVLKITANRLSESLRGGDTVARVGGDEFLIVLTLLSDINDAETVARKILNRISEPAAIERDEIYVTSSIGVALYPRDGEDAQSLIRCADGAMYRVKESGGHDVGVSSRSGKRSVGRLSLEEQIGTALQNDEFVVHYQPQFHLRKRTLSGAEALVRWQRPDGNLVGPAGFLTVSEHSGLISQLGEAVLLKACRQMTEWLKVGTAPPRIGVNVSARQFYQRDFVGMVERVLTLTGLAPGRLELEITETVAMQITERSLSTLRGLRAMGIAIAVDDFGTGQSSLSYLKRFPVDTVKIDRSFVADIVSGQNDEWIITAVLMLANHLGLRTVAEGVEIEEQCDFLDHHDCREIQGYLISKPLEPDEFARRFLVKAESKKQKAEI